MALKDDFLSIFNKMKGADPEYDENDMADQIGEKIKAYVADRALTITPSPATGTDTSPAGAFTGSVTASWAIQGTPIAASIKAVFAGMKTGALNDSALAAAFGTGLTADMPTWTASLSGQTITTTTPPQTLPSADSGTITSVFNPAPVVSKLTACFNDMKSMTSTSDNPDEKFATDLASAIETYYTSSVNTGKGSSHLAGVAFTVTVS